MDDSYLHNHTWLGRFLRNPGVQKAGPVVFFAGLFILFFSPVIFSGHLLAPNDGLSYNLPNFYSPRTLWTPLLFGGFPTVADPQAQTWYPLSLLFSKLPHGWNAFIISGYVLAAWFMFGYVRSVTGSARAGLVAGIAYSLSGFLIGRLGQVPLIHSAIWLPLLFWVLENNRRQPSNIWSGIGSLAIACSFLGGHPQMTFYGFFLAGVYVLVLGWNLEERRWRYFGRCCVMLALGMSLVAIQILPTLELVEWSDRSHLTFVKFVDFSMVPEEVLTLLFPYLFGGDGGFHQVSYYGESRGFLEPPGYLGILTLMLAGVAVAGFHSHRIVMFWLATLVVGFVLALGEHTPFSQLLFHAPGFNKFRAPVRHFLEITLAVSVLAGFGAALLERRGLSYRKLTGMVVGFAGIFGLALAGVFFYADFFDNYAALRNVKAVQIVSFGNPAIWVPVVVLALTSAALMVWGRKPDRWIPQVLLIAALVVDLGSFSWFHLWRYFSPNEITLSPPPSAARYQKLLNATHQRLIPVQGLLGEVEQFPVNLSRLWGIPSANGYNPMVLERVNRVLSRYESGVLSNTWSSVRSAGLDLFAVKYMFFPKGFKFSLEMEDHFSWGGGGLDLRLGSGCGMSYPESARLVLPEGVKVSQIGIVGTALCAWEVPGGETVLNFRLSGDSGGVRDVPVVMGRDISEFGYDCTGVKELVRHPRAEVFMRVSGQHQGRPCQKNKYVTKLPVTMNEPVRTLKIETAGQQGVYQLDKITFHDEASGTYFLFSEVTGSGDWKFKERIRNTVVYENKKAMPRAWLVPEVMAASPESVLHAIQYSNLPDGRVFDPAQVALVEEGQSQRIPSFDSSGKAEILKLENTEMIVRTQSSSEAFLVTSDVYYPGWEATIDGKPAHLLRTDYVLRGLPLPPGNHEVHFRFRPTSFYAGLGVTLISILLLVLWMFNPFSRRRA